MPIAESLIQEFDQEMASTRKCLERVPDVRLDWGPHPKSMTFRHLATHLSNLPTWASLTLEHEEFDIAPPDQEPPRAEPVKSTAEALERFDSAVNAARTAIAAATDERLMGDWSLLSAGDKVFTMPRVAVLRNMVINHLIHHRGQMSVYLRLNEIPVPSIYGPSADEAM